MSEPWEGATPPSWQEIAEGLGRRLSRTEIERDAALNVMERAVEERDRMERVAAEKTQAEFERNQMRGQVERDNVTIGDLGTELVRLRQELDEGFDERSRLRREVESLARRCAVRYEETEKLRTELEYAKGWQYFAGLAFAYVDAPDTVDTEVAWHELADAIVHYRKTGGPEPRDRDWQPGDPVYPPQPEWITCGACGTAVLWTPDLAAHHTIPCPECGGPMDTTGAEVADV